MSGTEHTRPPDLRDSLDDHLNTPNPLCSAVPRARRKQPSAEVILSWRRRTRLAALKTRIHDRSRRSQSCPRTRPLTTEFIHGLSKTFTPLSSGSRGWTKSRSSTGTWRRWNELCVISADGSCDKFWQILSCPGAPREGPGRLFFFRLFIILRRTPCEMIRYAAACLHLPS